MSGAAAPPHITPRGLGLAAAGVLLAICASYLWLDRPAAFLMHRLFHHSPWFLLLAAIGQVPLTFALPGLGFAAISGVCGWRPASRGWLAIACGLATGLTIAAKDMLKAFAGRTWPETWVDGNPSLIRDGVYGFHPFHGGAGWSSFPSGHTAAIAAVIGVLWWRQPRHRPLWAALVALTALGLLCGNIHFLSDILAGGALGFAIGTAVLALPWPAEDRAAHG